MGFCLSILFSSAKEVDGYVKQVGKLYKVFKGGFRLSVFVTDIGRLREPQSARHLTLGQAMQFA